MLLDATHLIPLHLHNFSGRLARSPSIMPNTSSNPSCRQSIGQQLRRRRRSATHQPRNDLDHNSSGEGPFTICNKTRRTRARPLARLLLALVTLSPDLQRAREHAHVYIRNVRLRSSSYCISIRSFQHACHAFHLLVLSLRVRRVLRAEKCSLIMRACTFGADQPLRRRGGKDADA